MKMTPTPGMTPAEALLKARQQLFLLLSGQLPMSVETPQLGRVQYSAPSVTDMRQLIDYLQGQVAAGGGDVWVPAGQGSMGGPSTGRKPISFYARP